MSDTNSDSKSDPAKATVQAAHALYIELATRIATQRLHYRSEDEESAATSIYNVVGAARKLMIDNPTAKDFERYTLLMLNEVVRPYTARWHGWMKQESDKIGADGKPLLRFRDEWVRRKFREELLELQPHLVEFKDLFERLAEGATLSEKEYNELVEKYRVDRSENVLGDSIPLKIRPQVILRGSDKNGRIDTALTSPEEDLASKMAKAEKEVIRKRRAAFTPDEKDEPAQEPEGTPSEDVLNASGLALSGGGIRSATFCLGIVQILQKKNLFPHFDYLSTVSGGGYLGTFLSSCLGVDREHLKAVETKVEKERPADLNGEVKRAADTPTDTPQDRLERIFKTPENGSESEAFRQLRNNSRYLLNGGTWGVFSILGTFLTGVGSSFLILVTLPIAAAWLLLYFKNHNLSDPLRDGFHGLLWLLVALWLLLPLARRYAQGAKWDSWASKIASLVANCALAVAILAIVVGMLGYGEAMIKGYDDLRFQLWQAKVNGFAMLKKVPLEKIFTAFSGVVSLVAARLSKRSDGTKRPAATWVFGITGPLFFILLFLNFASAIGVGGHQRWEPCAAGGASAFLIVWTWAFLNINTFSLHNYYRNRLCECYLAVEGLLQRTWLTRLLDSLLHGVKLADSTETITGVGTLQRLPLSALGHNLAAPYHLINATLNAAASKNPTLRGRDGDFFLFSRFFCGSPLTGYITTPDLEKADPHMDLGTAMAVSGAAASTNMGWQTMRQYRFLMTLFNIRLGYWLRRPGSAARWRLFEGPGPFYFFRELFGSVQEKTTYINLSDGGHLENLAVYELLRRQCKFILCVDGGMEPGMECADLMRLQRYAIIDLGIEMQFDLADLTLLPTSYCRAYAILVKIDYEPGAKENKKLGWMLYLKLALTGTEPRYVLDYRRQNPTFPHQTTGDQIYDEAQFEAYRALGEAAAQSLFREEIVGKKAPANLSDWFQKLAANLLPDNDEVFKK